MNAIVAPFQAILYSQKNRKNISQLAIADLDSAQHLWGDVDSSLAFRNVLMGPVQQRGEIWQAWLSAKETELLEDPAYFIVNHQTETPAGKVNRWSLLASIDIMSGDVLIHEDVFSEGVERARQSMETCEGDLAPIFVGTADTTGKKLRGLLQNCAKECESVLKYREGALAMHQVWICKNKEWMQKISTIFQEEKIFLLDGHHRLAAARENFKKGLGDGRLMASICSMELEDTLILPIHRSIYYEKWILPDRFYADLSAMGCKWKELSHWKPEQLPELLRNLKRDSLTFLALHSNTNILFEVSLPKAPALPAPLQDLAIANFEILFSKKIPKATIFPVSEERVVLEQLAIDQAQVGIFLPPIRADQVRVVALAGIKMPKKSTRFVPKPALGLVCRPWT